MRGVADEKHPANTVFLGNDIASGPADDRDHLVWNGGTSGLVEMRLDIDRLRIVVISLARDGEAIQFLAVNHDKVAPAALVIDEEGQRRLALVVVLPQFGQAHEGAQMVFGLGLAGHANAKGTANGTMAAAAIDDIARGDGLLLVARQIADRCDYLVAVFDKRFEF